MSSIQERVNNGVVLLDSTIPGWWKKIDPKNFHLFSCDRCVLGQVFGTESQSGFGVGLAKLGWEGRGLKHTQDQVGIHGFGQFEYEDEWDTAENLWRGIISERQAQDRERSEQELELELV